MTKSRWQMLAIVATLAMVAGVAGALYYHKQKQRPEPHVSRLTHSCMSKKKEIYWTGAPALCATYYPGTRTLRLFAFMRCQSAHAAASFPQ